MTKISYRQARKDLIKACQQYLVHNQAQLDSLMAKSPSYPPDLFFGQVFHSYTKTQPDPGFQDWVACEYFVILEHLLRGVSELFLHGKWVRFDINFYLHEGRDSAEYEMEFLRGVGEKISSEDDPIDQSDPEIALHNLQALLSLFNHVMRSRVADFEEIKKQKNYSEESYMFAETRPLSVKIYKTFQRLHSLSRFAAGLPESAGTELPDIPGRLMRMSPIFEGYLKGVAVRELQATLQSKLSDEKAVKAVEAQLGNGITLEVLRKNRQSSWEQNLKLLSVISMLIGVGIFTTLGLACKRYYDSGGTSINFFKPLSENLCETMIQITENTHPHMP